MPPIAQTIVDALSQGSLFALIALGIALIFGIMGLMNFAHGELIMIGAYTLFLLRSLGDAAAISLAFIACIAVALLLDRVAFRPVRRASPTTLLVTSFAVSYLLQNLSMLTFGARNKSETLLASLDQFVGFAGLRVPLYELAVLGVAATALLVLSGFLRFTELGIHMRAAAEDFSMARALGVRANRVIAAAFAISGALAAAVSALLVTETGVLSPTMGLQPALIGFVATVIGGMGSLVGAVVGGLVLGALSSILQTVLPYEWRAYRDAITFALVIVILLLRPNGLIARTTRARV